MNKLKIDHIRRRVLRVAESLNGRFTTEDLVHDFAVRFPVSWRYLVRQYAPSGKGAGRPYSAGTRVAMMLLRLANQGQIKRRKYVQASPAWGNPWVRTWQS